MGYEYTNTSEFVYSYPIRLFVAGFGDQQIERGFGVHAAGFGAMIELDQSGFMANSYSHGHLRKDTR